MVNAAYRANAIASPPDQSAGAECVDCQNTVSIHATATASRSATRHSCSHESQRISETFTICVAIVNARCGAVGEAAAFATMNSARNSVVAAAIAGAVLS